MFAVQFQLSTSAGIVKFNVKLKDKRSPCNFCVDGCFTVAPLAFFGPKYIWSCYFNLWVEFEWKVYIQTEEIPVVEHEKYLSGSSNIGGTVSPFLLSYPSFYWRQFYRESRVVFVNEIAYVSAIKRRNDFTVRKFRTELWSHLCSFNFFLFVGMWTIFNNYTYI